MALTSTVVVEFVTSTYYPELSLILNFGVCSSSNVDDLKLREMMNKGAGGAPNPQVRVPNYEK